MSAQAASGKPGGITFRFCGKVYLLCDASGKMVRFDSKAAALSRIRVIRRLTIEDGNMESLLGDLLFDFRAHEYLSIGAANLHPQRFGALRGAELSMSRETLRFHESGAEARPAFRTKRPTRRAGSKRTQLV